MPNGNPDYLEDEFADYEAYFSPISEALQVFAIKHNLLVEKYYHEAPVWSLCFCHPEGGSAKLDVSRGNDEFVELRPVWWIDEYESFCRNLKWGEKERISRENTVLTKRLNSALRAVLNWNIGEWSDVAKGYEQIWGRYSAEEFEAMSPSWPTPKL